MLEVQQVQAPRKSEMRTSIIDTIVKCMMQEKIYKTLDYRNKNEQYLKQYMHQPLQSTMVEVFRRVDRGSRTQRSKRRRVWPSFGKEM